MADVVKKRKYRSPVREQQAAHTRARIVEAAGELFETQGYGRTTVRQIAQAAGVAPDTVYAVFGTKIRVLTALLDARLVPPGEPGVLDRPEVAAVRDEPDQRHQIELFARDITGILERIGPVYEILRTAAAVEPEAAAVYEEMNGYRLASLLALPNMLVANGPLRVDIARAAEVVWTLASPDVARLLRHERGWSADAYATWLADTLARTLLVDVSVDAHVSAGSGPKGKEPVRRTTRRKSPRR
jgi:AcrR family transcriptional regulator